MTLKIWKILWLYLPIFIAIMSDEESQRQIRRENMEPENALNLVINYERGLKRQIKLCSSTIHTKSGSTKNFLTRTRAVKTRNFKNMSIGYHKLNPTWQKCGQVWNYKIIKICPVQGKNFLSYGLQNYFTKLSG